MRRSGLFLCTAGVFTAGSVNAQSSGVLITGRDMALVSAATAAAGVVSLFDTPVARAFGDSAFHLRHPDFTTAAKRGSLPTETVFMVSGAVVYGVAHYRHDLATEDVAFHTFESVASAAMFIQVVRGALGRARPYVIDEVGERRDGDPYDFQFFHGFTSFNYRSFPSMHAMASMAVASALSQEMRLRDTPHRAVFSPLLYAGAVVPSLSRMYLEEHWTSDILLGAFLGVFAGQKIVQYSHDHPDNRVDNRFLNHSLSAVVTHDAGGFSFRVTPF